MKQAIRESIREMQRGDDNFPQDPTLMDDGEIKTGPERFAKTQKQKDEVVIDKLLAPIQNKSGYFMKLKKELRPGEWMLMKTIENEWRNWPDIEAEVSKIVKEHTKKAPQKWGSGAYRIEYACTSGIRGENYPNVDMSINAEEEFLNNLTGTIVPTQPGIDPSTAVAGQIDTLANLVGMLKNFLPQATDPVKTQEQIASAFEKGLAIKAGEGNNNNQVMATMMTGMFGLMTAMMSKQNEGPRVVNPPEGDQFRGMLETLKTFGVIGQQQVPEKQKTTIDFITELKMLGMDLFKKENPIEQITQLKTLASIAGDFMGMGGTTERPGVLEKLVDAIAPALPQIVSDIKEAAGSAVRVQQIAGQNIERARITTMDATNMTAQPQVQSQPQQGPAMNVGSGVPTNNAQVTQFFIGLYEAVNMNNRMFYPIIYTSLLQDAKGQALLTGIANGSQTAKELIELLQEYGGEKYRESEFVVKRLVSYTNGFIIWIREMMKPKAFGGNTNEVESPSPVGQPVTHPVMNETYDAECGICHTVYAFKNEKEYAEETDKTCEVEENGKVCGGVLKPMQKAS